MNYFKFQELFYNFQHDLILIKEKNLFWQTITIHCTDLFLLFDENNKLVFQNKEVPNNLK